MVRVHGGRFAVADRLALDRAHFESVGQIDAQLKQPGVLDRVEALPVEREFLGRQLGFHQFGDGDPRQDLLDVHRQFVRDGPVAIDESPGAFRAATRAGRSGPTGAGRCA